MPLESPVQRDGDMGFAGYASRMNPLTLPAGMLQISENMRLDRGVAVTRKGAKRLADGISPGTVPLTVPFVLSPAPNERIVQSSYDGGIFASAIMRSPDESNSVETIILAGPDRAFTFLTDGAVQASVAWSDGALAVDANEYFVTDEDTQEEIVTSKLPLSIAYPTSPDETVEPTDKVSMVQAFDRLYLLREADVTRVGWGTQRTLAAGIAVSGTVATVNVQGHGYSAGMRVRIEGSVAAAFDGHEYDIQTVPDADSLTIEVPSGTDDTGADVANIAVRRVKPPMYWTGDVTTAFVRTPAGIPDVGISYRRLRSVGWANYINNRLVVADGKQNVMISDILDPDTFDIYWQSFRVGVGGNDFVVGVHPWVEGKVLVFCRKSIWLADVQQYPSPDGGTFSTQTGISNLMLLTDEIGCSARRSITTAGSFIYFLSDSGVYRLDSRLDLKLRGDTRPLSDPISDQVSRLNSRLVADSVGFYFGNRFYIAVPLAGGDKLDGVFIYNQLLEQWETRDVYGFGVDNFLVADIDNERRILISNQAGKLMLLDELEDGDDPTEEDVVDRSPVPGRIVTRRYGMNTMTSKRFVRSLSDVVLPDTGAITVRARMINPDQTLTLVPGQTNDSGLAEDYTLKNPIRAKAHYAEIEFLTTANRPEIRNVSVEAALASRPQTETRHAA